jgi:prophage tail gpP-like protein
MSSINTLVNELATGLLDDSTNPNTLTLLINGEKVNVSAATVKCSIENAASGFSAIIPLSTDFKNLPIKPFGFEDCELYLGKELIITGRVYIPEPDFSVDGYSATVEGVSLAADFVDSKIYPPLEYNFITLGELVDALAEQIGMTAEYEYSVGSNFFERATADHGDTMFEFLSKLAGERGVLITSNAKGKICLVQANISGKPVCCIGDEKNPLSKITSKFDGRKLFHSYRATSTSPTTVLSNSKKRKKKIYKDKTIYRTITIVDAGIPEGRQTSARCDNVTVGDAEKTAMQLQRKAYADAIEIHVPVNSWYVPGTEDLWRENTIVTIQSPAAWLHNGFDMLIRGVTYTYANSGCIAILDVCPPQCYSDKAIPANLFSEEGPSGIDTMLAEIGINSGLTDVTEEIR